MPRVQNLVDAGFSVKAAHALTGTVAATVAAAGSDQAGATLIAADNNLITTATEAQGVRLPASWIAGDIWVCNGTAVNVLVYPATGVKLNNQTTNDPLTLPAGHAAVFKAVTSTQCFVKF